MNIKEQSKNLRRKIRNFFLTSNASISFLTFFYKAICGSIRYTQFREIIAEQDEIATARKHGSDIENKLAVFCLWHDELFPLMHVKRDLEIVCIVSPSKDGTILNNFLQRLGLKTVSGSSRKQGLKALLSGAKMMRQEQVHACITVDGPMGPRHKTKDGAFLLAQKANAKVVPVRIIMHNSIKMPSWDKFQIPLPFSKVEIRFAEGFFVEDELTEENLIIYRERLENGLNNLEYNFGQTK